MMALPSAALSLKARVTPLTAVAKALTEAALLIRVKPTDCVCWQPLDHWMKLTAIAPPTLPRMAFCTAALLKVFR